MSLVNKYTLKHSLCEKFDGIIWKIETDSRQNIIAIEVRNADRHTATFSAFDFSTGHTLFKDVGIEDSWGWGLDRVVEGKILLHSYVTEKSPEHKGIIALGADGTVSWQHFNKTLHTVTEQGLIAYNPSVQPRRYELLSPASGLPAVGNPAGLPPAPRNIIVPEAVSDPLSVRHSLPQNVFGPILFTSFNGKDFLAFHIASGQAFSQQVLIYQGDNIILDDIISSGIQKLNPEAFFIEHNHLFYIRNNKQEIVSYLV